MYRWCIESDRNHFRSPSFSRCTAPKPAQFPSPGPHPFTPPQSWVSASDYARFTRNGTNDFVCDNLWPQAENLHHKLRPRLNFVSLLSQKPCSFQFVSWPSFIHIHMEVWKCVATKVFALRFRITVLNPFTEEGTGLVWLIFEILGKSFPALGARIN